MLCSPFRLPLALLLTLAPAVLAFDPNQTELVIGRKGEEVIQVKHLLDPTFSSLDKVVFEPGVDCSKHDFSSCTLYDAKLGNGNFSRAKFNHVDLTRTEFGTAKLKRCEIYGATLRLTDRARFMAAGVDVSQATWVADEEPAQEPKPMDMDMSSLEAETEAEPSDGDQEMVPEPSSRRGTKRPRGNESRSGRPQAGRTPAAKKPRPAPVGEEAGRDQEVVPAAMASPEPAAPASSRSRSRAKIRPKVESKPKMMTDELFEECRLLLKLDDISHLSEKASKRFSNAKWKLKRLYETNKLPDEWLKKLEETKHWDPVIRPKGWNNATDDPIPAPFRSIPRANRPRSESSSSSSSSTGRPGGTAGNGMVLGMPVAPPAARPVPASAPVPAPGPAQAPAPGVPGPFQALTLLPPLPTVLPPGYLGRSPAVAPSWASLMS